jgi:hypothetical protein
VSEQEAEQGHGGGSSVNAEPATHTSSEPTASGMSAPVASAVSETGAAAMPAISPDHEAPLKDETPKAADKIAADTVNDVKADAIKSGIDKDAVEKAQESLLSGRLLIMSPGVRAWQSEAKTGEAKTGEAEAAKAEAEPVIEAPAKRRFTGMAAIIALATLAGAISGAMATIGVTHFIMTADAAATAGNAALEASMSRIDADIVALKAGLELAAKTNQGQFNKATDRIEKIEKAQAEPTSKLAKLSEAVDKLRAAQAAVPAGAAATTSAAEKEATGSVTQSANRAAASTPSTPPVPAAPKTDVARLPTVEGWVLRDVNRGGALIEGRQGLYEVYAGDPVPGLGRVDAIRKQDGRWVVVTSKGLIISR